ncbi:type VI secretion system protein TssL, long form [Thiobaca trueperi]|uniref:Chemotaxis protein MotB n=1 Tax=Thiobaca trueperi TaxID=127458 RepID=A0A4R3N3S0_9GAMM|nr:type VI secretion system protein TssL, long form [Thiobaca trueperi]TCT22861.1 chemotaxis protein MotB [Thiobaca trueperi]
MDEETECPECPAGIPEWVMTFADLMSLMMCFFVLLLSFSEMDVLKFKQIAGSMQVAFGVQREDKSAMAVPMGTSIIAQEFSSAQPDPTPLNQVQQQTTDTSKQYLDIKDPAVEDAENKAEELQEALKTEIKEGLLEVSTIDDQVIVRIREKGSFPSASSKVDEAFMAVLTKISDALNQVEGRILVAGHTDNIPIQTREFASNWILSGARAAAVADTLTERGSVAHERVEIRAYADNRPLEPNDTPEGRAKNRRVEIIVLGDRGANAALNDAAEPAGTSPVQ